MPPPLPRSPAPTTRRPPNPCRVVCYFPGLHPQQEAPATAGRKGNGHSARTGEVLKLQPPQLTLPKRAPSCPRHAALEALTCVLNPKK